MRPGPGCGQLRPCRRHLGHTLTHPGLTRGSDFPVATHRRPVRGQVSAWVTHVAIAGPGPGICHESENWSGPARAPTQARHNLSSA